MGKHRDEESRRSSSSKHRSKKSKHRKHSSRLPHGVKEISEDDYFLRATEFRVWLAQEKKKYVEDLSSDDAMHLFQSKFVKKWNSGRLERMYYTGIPEQVLEQTKRTRHQWGFLKKMNEKERFDLASARDSVGIATRKSDLLTSGPSSVSNSTTDRKRERERSPEQEQDKRRHHQHSSGSGSRHHRDDDYSREDRKRARRHHREEVATALEEMIPKETGREAQLEKKRQTAYKIHAAARDREETRDGLDLSDDFLMGGGSRGSDDLQRRLAQREATRNRKEQERNEKVASLAAKESARMDKFLADMGLSGANQGPITIAPRK